MQPKERKLSMQSRRWHPRVVQSARCPVRESSSPRVGNPRVGVSASCPVTLWPNGWTYQNETWHAGRPRPWTHCVRWGPGPPPPKGRTPPIFGPYLLRPNGCMDQHATLYGGRPRPRRLCVRWEHRSPLKKGGRSPQIFGACLLWYLAWK